MTALASDYVQEKELGLVDFASLTPVQFNAYYQHELKNGHALYRRMATSAMDAVVNILHEGSVHPCIMLGSNNYLGFSNDPYVKKCVIEAMDLYGCGVSGPPLLNGHTSLHRELEQRLAKLKRAEDTLLFASGYQANVGIVEACLKPGDVFIYDELSHASLIDGLKLVRTTKRIRSLRFKHNDLNDLKLQLARAETLKNQSGFIYVAIEGVYSMDGDIAPLDEIVAICEFYGARIILDDAHGTGVMGANGGGTCEHFELAGRCYLIMGTFSKAFGMTGGFVCGSTDIINYLRFFSRAYIFSAHLPTTTIAAVLAGIDLIEREPHRRKICLENARILREALNNSGFSIHSQTPILPIPIAEDISIRHVNKRLFEEKIFVNAIEYPAVPLNTQRLRLSVSYVHSPQELKSVAQTFAQIAKEFGL